jgi:S-formylglutathione hydrolase FrmB
MKRQANKGRVVLEQVTSRVLAGNPLGDPHVRTVPVYLPPGYDDAAERGRRYPVIHVLAGFTGSGRMLLNVTPFGEALDARLDRLIGSGKMKPCIVVMPDCLTAYGGSQYINSRATGRYGDHLIKELVPYIDRRFRTLPGARHRAVAGKSSGGYGAIVHGMWHPDVFSAVACHSGDMAFEYCYQPGFPETVIELEKAGSQRAWLRKFHAAKKKSPSMWSAWNTLGMASCYSPNPSAELGCDLPIDLWTGELIPRVWNKWLALDPVHMVSRHAKALKKLRLCFLDCGTRDQFYLYVGARIFAKRAREHGVRVVHEEFDDNHSDVSYRYDVSLPRLARAIS